MYKRNVIQKRCIYRFLTGKYRNFNFLFIKFPAVTDYLKFQQQHFTLFHKKKEPKAPFQYHLTGILAPFFSITHICKSQ